MQKTKLESLVIAICALMSACSAEAQPDPCHMQQQIGKSVTVQGTYCNAGTQIMLDGDPKCFINIEPEIVGQSGEVTMTTSYNGGPSGDSKNWVSHRTNVKKLTDMEAERMIRKMNRPGINEGDHVKATGRLCHLTSIVTQPGAQLPCPFSIPRSHYFFCVDEVTVSIVEKK